jgi:hypothetical protein
MEKRLLQIVIVMGAVIAVLSGLEGVVRGPALAGASSIEAGADSQFRFLSGLLVGVGGLYALLVPRIEAEGERLFFLTLIVVVGGFCRAVGMLIAGPEGIAGYLALAMALVGAPAIYLWQTRVAHAVTGHTASMDALGPWV